MTRTPRATLALAALALAALPLAGRPALAAPDAAADRMPTALARTLPVPPFRHVVANGTTKPAGAALDARGGLTPALAEREHRIHDLVATAICRGC